MRIDYVSDLHFDTHLGIWPHVRREDFLKRFERAIVPLFEKRSADILLVAGDIGESNGQNIEVLRLICERIGYRHIVMVLGNHDWFLPDSAARSAYQGNSEKRVEAFRQMVAAEAGMVLLDGDVVEIEGIRIGGAMGWYDGSYVMYNLNPYYEKGRDHLQRLWVEKSPDSDQIFGMNAFDGLFAREMEKIERVYHDCDVMMTHINPSIRPAHSASRWRSSDTTGFFTFDGSGFLKKTTARYWVFGHTHARIEYKAHRVQCISNPFGYPREGSASVRVMGFEIPAKAHVS